MTLTSDWLLQAALRATLILAGLRLAWYLLPSSLPALRRTLLLICAALLLPLPWLSGWHGLPILRSSPVSLSLAGSHSPNATLTSGLAALWLLGTLTLTLQFLRQSAALRRLIREATPFPRPDIPPGWSLLKSTRVSGPCVARLRRPVLLIPHHAASWNSRQWAMVLAHEQQHLRQGDLLLAWLPRLVLGLFWWHPLAHWLQRQWHAESEALCDHAVLHPARHSARDYVEFLLSLDASRHPATACAMALKSPLGERLQRLLQPSPRPLRRWAILSALAILLTSTLISLSLGSAPPVPSPGSAPDPLPQEARLRLTANPFPLGFVTAGPGTPVWKTRLKL